jgi:integrase/recombinase XerD
LPHGSSKNGACIVGRRRRDALDAGLKALDEYLRRRGLVPHVIADYGRAARHVAHWLDRRRTPLGAIDEHKVRIFITRHLPRCRCVAPGPRTLTVVRAALAHYLRVLRGREDIPARAPDETPAIQQALEEFDVHLRDTCGLAPATRALRRFYVAVFLRAAFGQGPVDARRLTPARIIGLVTRRVSGCRAQSAQVIASCLRSWLRFQQFLGHCDSRLVCAVPRPTHRGQVSLPVALTEPELARLVRSADRTTASGRRDFALLRCMADLGLRAGEVAALRLDDIDWRQGTLRVRAGKERRTTRLPMPATVGRAIAAYLQRGRPSTSTREIFVRHTVRRGEAAGYQGVRYAVSSATQRAGLGNRGTHFLRHTAATWMLRGGATFPEIASVLRHRSFDSTAIYARVDTSALAEVALPWPGRA